MGQWDMNLLGCISNNILDLGVTEKAVDPECGDFDRETYFIPQPVDLWSAIFCPPLFQRHTNGLLDNSISFRLESFML